MNRVLPALLCLLGTLAGCEDTGVDNVLKREIITAKELLEIQEASGAVLVEVHGLPWEGADHAEVAGTLRMPEGPGREVRFRPVPPGQGLIGSGARLVLAFNPAAGTSAARACQSSGEIATEHPGGDGFTLKAVFCRGGDWLIQASFDASDVDRNDWLAYYLRMMVLLDVMFPPK